MTEQHKDLNISSGILQRNIPEELKPVSDKPQVVNTPEGRYYVSAFDLDPSKYNTILLISEKNNSYYSVTVRPKNAIFTNDHDINSAYIDDIINHKIRYESVMGGTDDIPFYKESIFGMGMEPVFDTIDQAIEYSRKAKTIHSEIVKTMGSENISLAPIDDFNLKYPHSVRVIKNGDAENPIYRVPVFTTAAIDNLITKDNYSPDKFVGDGFKESVYVDFNDIESMRDFCEKLNSYIMDNKTSKSAADSLQLFNTHDLNTDKEVYERVNQMTTNKKLFQYFGAESFTLPASGISTLDKIKDNLPSTEISFMTYNNGEVTFTGKDNNTYKMEHLTNDSLSKLYDKVQKYIDTLPFYLSALYFDKQSSEKALFDAALAQKDTQKILSLSKEHSLDLILEMDYIHKSPIKSKNDIIIASDKEQTLVYNNKEDSYQLYQNTTGLEVRHLIAQSYESESMTDDVKALITLADMNNQEYYIDNYYNKNNTIMEENKEKTYYLSVSYFDTTDAQENLDPIRKNGSKEELLNTAAMWDEGAGIDQPEVRERATPYPGEEVIASNDNYSLVYNAVAGGTYELLRKVTEQDIRDSITSYGLEYNASESVKKIAYRMTKEEFDGIKKEPTFIMDNGETLHFQYNEETNKIEVGGVTNSGLHPLHEFDYDHSSTLDANLANVYELLSEMEEYQSEEVKNQDENASKVVFNNRKDLQSYITHYCEKHGPEADLNHIDVSRITDMSLLFAFSDFNGDISNWDTSNVKDMSYMFIHSDFNQPIGNWDVSRVEDMKGMFEGTPFNQNLDKWNVSNVKDMSFMFADSGLKFIPKNWKINDKTNTKSMYDGTRALENNYVMEGKPIKGYATPEQDEGVAREASPEENRMNMGGKWRMPTKEEFQEMIENGDVTKIMSMYDGTKARLYLDWGVITGYATPEQDEGVAREPSPKENRTTWTELKEKHPSAIILCNLKDKYAAYAEDAEYIAKELHIPLEKRISDGLSMVTFSKREFDFNLPKIIRSGRRVAIFDGDVSIKANNTQQQQDKPKPTPIVDKWKELKEQNPDTTVVISIDDRYISYGDDAKKVANMMGIGLLKDNASDLPLSYWEDSDKTERYVTILEKAPNVGVWDINDRNTMIAKPRFINGESEKAKDQIKSDPIEKWKELKAQNPNKITLMQYDNGYLTIGKDAAAIPRGIGLINRDFDTKEGRALVLSSLYKDLQTLQEKVGPLAVWDNIDTKDMKVRYYPENTMTQKTEVSNTQTQGQSEQRNETKEDKTPPTMKIYNELKEKNPDKLILIHTPSNFYLSYKEGAKECAEILGITLSKRKSDDIYKAGFPGKMADEYIAKLQKAGKSIIFGEYQTEESKEETAENKKEAKPEDEKKEEKTPEQKADEEANKVAQLIGTEYQAYLLGKALENAKENEGLFLNGRTMAAPSVYPHEISIPAFNQIIMTLHTERMGYPTNTYTTYRGASEAGIAVKRNEKSLGINNFGVSKFINTFDSSDVISKNEYRNLPPEKKQQYRPANKLVGFMNRLLMYNVAQTNMSSVYKDLYKKMIAETHTSKKNPTKTPKDNVKIYDIRIAKEPNSMPLFRSGHFIETYKESADALSKIVGVPVIEDKKKGCNVASFPARKLEDNLMKIVKAGYTARILDAQNVINGMSTLEHRNEAIDYLKNVAKQMGVEIDKTTFQLTAYEPKTDTISIHSDNNNPDMPHATDIKDINAMYRALSQAAEVPDRLDRSARILLNYGDFEKYDALVNELAAASLMLRQGLPARISEENMELIPYWQRELKENPDMVKILELNTNATIKAITRHAEGKDVDYSKLRGTKVRDLLPYNDYSILRALKEYPNVENKSVVIIRDDKKKTAAVVLPQGASIEVDNEIPGMNKHRYERALKKEGFAKVEFYNADGYLSINQPNPYFFDKKISVEKLHQYDLVEVCQFEFPEEIKKEEKINEKPVIERMRGLKNDQGYYEFYIKPLGREEFTIKPQYADATEFFTSFKDKVNGAKTREKVGQKYCEIAERYPEHLTNLVHPSTEGINTERLSNISMSRDYKSPQIVLQAEIDGEKVSKLLSVDYWWRHEAVEDKAAYDFALAANIFEKELGRKETQSENINEDITDNQEKKPEPVSVQSAKDSMENGEGEEQQDNTPEETIEQDEKKQVRRGFHR